MRSLTGTVGGRWFGGKWVYTDTGDADQDQYVALASDIDVPTWEEVLANAHVIAAAPDLYEAARAVLSRLDYLRELWGDEGVTRTLADRLRAAVAKVKGGAS